MWWFQKYCGGVCYTFASQVLKVLLLRVSYWQFSLGCGNVKVAIFQVFGFISNLCHQRFSRIFGTWRENGISHQSDDWSWWFFGYRTSVMISQCSGYGLVRYAFSCSKSLIGNSMDSLLFYKKWLVNVYLKKKIKIKASTWNLNMKYTI